METTTITMIAILVVIALLLVWLSLSMAATEGAVGRVTRASLNNLILEIQTDTEASQFIRDKKIKRIHKVQRLIADRYATAGSCAFFRITCNVLDGVLVPRSRRCAMRRYGRDCLSASCSRWWSR